MWTLKTQASRTAQAGTPPRKAKAKLERFWGLEGSGCRPSPGETFERASFSSTQIEQEDLRGRGLA